VPHPDQDSQEFAFQKRLAALELAAEFVTRSTGNSSEVVELARSFLQFLSPSGLKLVKTETH
jgi:hypothetical protein